MVEVLLSLSLMAILLASVAAAMQASLWSYEQADNTADVSQTMRVVLDRMEREVRTASSVESPDPATLLITGVAPAQVKYSYTRGTLTLNYSVSADGATWQTYPLLAGTDSVTANSFSVTLQPCVVNQQTVTQSATATIGLAVGGQQLTMHASAAVRRNQSY
jgi:type II secretory pathway pseudopilin PulG